MNRRVLPLLVSVLVVAGSSLCTADAVKKWTIDLGVQGTEYKFDSTLHLDNKFGPGFRIGLVIHPAFQVEATYDTVSTRRSEARFADSEYKQEFYGIQVMGVFRAAEDVRANPYMIVGGGTVKTTFDPGTTGSTVRDDRSVFGDAGFGVRYQIWKGLHANGELLVRHLRTLDKSGTDACFSAGLSWTLGGSKK